MHWVENGWTEFSGSDGLFEVRIRRIAIPGLPTHLKCALCGPSLFTQRHLALRGVKGQKAVRLLWIPLSGVTSQDWIWEDRACTLHNAVA
jgi:hypothetical protein